MLTLAALLAQLRTVHVVGEDADPGVRSRRIMGAATVEDVPGEGTHAEGTPAEGGPAEDMSGAGGPAEGGLADGGPADRIPGRAARLGLLTARVVVGPLDAPLWQDATRARQTVRALMHDEAAALLLVAAPGADPGDVARTRETVAATAGRVGLPLLVMEHDERTCAEVVESVAAAVEAAHAASEVRLLKALADLLRSPGPAGTGDLERLLDQTARAVDGQAAVIAPDGSIVQSGGYAPRLSRSILAAPVSQVRAGGPGVTASGESGCFVQLLGIDVPAPRPVLAVARSRPHSPRVTDLIRRTADTLALKERIVRADQLDREFAETVPAALLALYTHLMNGDVDNCGKLADAYVPGLLDSGQIQVCLLECPAPRRAEMVDAVTAAAGAGALVVAHPGSATRVAVIAPARAGDGSTRLRQALEAAAEPFGCSIGQSRPVSCRNTRDAHQMAAHALAVARRLPHRAVTHQGEKPLALLLGPEAAGWARWVLRRLDPLPDREMLTSTVQQALQHGNSGAARLIGVNRKTIALRCRRVGTALGFDLTDLRARAALDLALHIAVRAPQQPLPATPPAPAASPQSAAAPPQLADLLRAPAARAWALDLLAPLRRDSRPLLETVQAWITCNGRVESCAEQLKVHANTVRNHLAACEAALGRRLVGTSGGAYDVVNAMEILHPAGAA